MKSKGLRFGKDEFVLVIGLSFGPIPKYDKRSSRIREKYFKGEKKMHIDQLERGFLSLGNEKEKKKNNNKKQKKMKEPNDEDVVRLALLYLLEHVLLEKEGKNLIRYAMGFSSG